MLFAKKPIIEFFCHPNLKGVIPEPRPASKHIPEWFKSIPQTSTDKRDTFGNPAMTAKKCLPMLDAMSLGYIIPLACDLRVVTNNDCSMINITNSPEITGAEFHNIEQLGGKTGPGFPAPPVKFINYWVIKTRPGWSTLVMPLINGDNPNFTCLSGLVDTDRYVKEINFPAIWHTPNFDDRLPAGTPLVVVIPVKRSAIPKKPSVRDMTDAEFKEVEIVRKKQQSRTHVYTSELREPRK
jgi:hypothetical protein